MEWQSIGYVTSGLTLVAFIVAACVLAYRRVLLQKQLLIRQAPEQDRARLVENALEFFQVDTSGLTKDAKYEIAMKQINERAVRFKITALVIVIIACLATGVSIYALSRDSRETRGPGDPTPTQTSSPLVTITSKSTPDAAPATTPSAAIHSPTLSPTPLVDPNDVFDDKGSGQIAVEGMMIHKCADGYAMIGADVSTNIYKCRRIIPANEEQYVKTVVDKETQRSGMRACPSGMYMSGLALAPAYIICSYNSKRGLFSHAIESMALGPNPGMDLCDQRHDHLSYMTGFGYVDHKYFLCSTIRQP